MKILHILAKDATAKQQQQFLLLYDILSTVSDTHHSLIYTFKSIENALQERQATFEIQKFGGMFDLRTKKALQDIMSTFNPNIIVSHSEESAAFIAAHAKNTPHIGIINGSASDRPIASLCDHTVLMNEEQDDKAILKTALSRFEKVLKRNEEKT